MSYTKIFHKFKAKILIQITDSIRFELHMIRKQIFTKKNWFLAQKTKLIGQQKISQVFHSYEKCQYVYTFHLKISFKLNQILETNESDCLSSSSTLVTLSAATSVAASPASSVLGGTSDTISTSKYEFR